MHYLEEYWLVASPQRPAAAHNTMSCDLSVTCSALARRDSCETHLGLRVDSHQEWHPTPPVSTHLVKELSCETQSYDNSYFLFYSLSDTLRFARPYTSCCTTRRSQITLRSQYIAKVSAKNSQLTRHRNANWHSRNFVPRKALRAIATRL